MQDDLITTFWTAITSMPVTHASGSVWRASSIELYIDVSPCLNEAGLMKQTYVGFLQIIAIAEHTLAEL